MICSYSACIRRAAGYCCIEYQVCAGVSYAFSLDAIAANTIKAYVDSYCTTDHIAIPGEYINYSFFKYLSKMNGLFGFLDTLAT